jgi:predicted Zn-dependent protease
MLGQAGRKAEADAVIEEVAGRAPDVPEVQQALAGVRARQGRWQEAVALYRRAFAANPLLPRVGAMAIASQLGAGGPDAAPAAVALGRELAEAAPQDPALQGMLGVAYARTGDLATAELHLKAGLKAMVAEPEVAWWAGRVAAREGQVQIARKLYERELEHHPRTVGAALDLVTLLAEEQDYAAERALAKDLAERMPTEPRLWHAWAQSAFNLGELAEARGALDQALERFPKNPELVLLDANLLAKEGKRDEGRRRFDEARALKAAEQGAGGR